MPSGTQYGTADNSQAVQADLEALLTELQAKADLSETQPVSDSQLDVLLSTRATETTLSNLLTELQAKADLAETQPVSDSQLDVLLSTRATETTLSNLLATQQNQATVGHGQTTVSSAGTAEPLPSHAVPDGFAVTVKALNANTNLVYVGDSSVTSGTGFELAAGDSVSLYVDDVSDISLDVDTNGEGVSWIVEATA